MHLAAVKHGTEPTDEPRCVLCAKELPSGDLCEVCDTMQLDSLQLAKLFWDEV